MVLAVFSGPSAGYKPPSYNCCCFRCYFHHFSLYFPLLYTTCINSATTTYINPAATTRINSVTTARINSATTACINSAATYYYPPYRKAARL